MAGMNDAEPLRDKKKKKPAASSLEIKERIETESDELIELPRMIKRQMKNCLLQGHIIVLSVWQMEMSS